MAMNLQEWFAERDANWATRTRVEQHGTGELTLRDDVPLSATGCTLPDGLLTDAECLVAGTTATPDGERVWTRRLPNSALRRRGRLKVDSGKALIFIDERDADLDVSPAGDASEPPDLERDLFRSDRLRALVRSELFSTLLYSALCNTTWRKDAGGPVWSCSWRSAGGIVATLRAEGNYLDWYCSMGEGLVDEQVLAEIEALGWKLAEANPPDW